MGVRMQKYLTTRWLRWKPEPKSFTESIDCVEGGADQSDCAAAKRGPTLRALYLFVLSLLLSFSVAASAETIPATLTTSAITDLRYAANGGGGFFLTKQEACESNLLSIGNSYGDSVAIVGADFMGGLRFHCFTNEGGGTPLRQIGDGGVVGTCTGINELYGRPPDEHYYYYVGYLIEQNMCQVHTCPPNQNWTLSGSGATWVCTRPDQKTLTITLSGGTEVEPWNKETDAGHNKANLNYTATVLDSANQPAPNVEVTITTDVSENTGGHIHNTDRPKGKLAMPADPIKDGKETITGFSDSNGVYSFTFGSEEAAGTHTITATCTGCQASATALVDVKVNGLQPIPATPFLYSLQLPNRDTNHPATFYLTKASIEKLRKVALYYYAATFKKKKKGVIPDFVLNDASLEWGGVLDCFLTCNSAMYPSTPWHKHHIEHRRGSVVDVKANGSPGTIVYDRDFRYWATYFGVGVGNLHGSGSGLHYHLRLNNGAKE